MGLLELGGLGFSSDTISILGERNDSLVLENVTEVSLDLLNSLSLEHLGALPGSLKIDLDVVSAGFGVFLCSWVFGIVGHGL